jgi:hypothetical protein
MSHCSDVLRIASDDEAAMNLRRQATRGVAEDGAKILVDIYAEPEAEASGEMEAF